MKLKIKGNEYDIEEGLKGTSLQTLYVLKVKYGVSLKTMADAAKKLENATSELQILDDVENLQTLMVLIWLARRHAGEKMSLEEANDDFGLNDLVLVQSPEEKASSPKAQTGSVPAASVPEVPDHLPLSRT